MPSVYEWESEWVNVRQYIKRFGGYWVCESTIEMQFIYHFYHLSVVMENLEIFGGFFLHLSWKQLIKN